MRIDRAVRIAAGALALSACTDMPAPTAVAPTTVSPSARHDAAPIAPSVLEPGATDRVLFDSRTSLQQAQSMREALAVFQISADTRANWGFTTDMDGAGTHALRVDWQSAGGSCTTRSPVLPVRFGSPPPRSLFVQWKQHLGRTATGGGLGEIGAFDVFRPECGKYGRFAGMVQRDGSSHRVELKWMGPEPGGAALRVKGVGVELSPNQGWSFLPQEHVGAVIEQTLFVQTESAEGAADGVLRLWVNGRLLIDASGLSLGAAALSKFHLPWTSPAPLASQSEYLWGLVIWEPGTAPPPPPPPPPAAVASVAVAPPSAALTVGQTAQLTATPRDASGNVLTGRTAAWSSANPSVATVSSGGLVTGIAAGSTSVTAMIEGQSATATIIVNPVPPPPPPPPPPPSGDVAVLVGAGDIADCGTASDEATAKLLDGIGGAVFTAGDNAYDDGTTAQFTECYQPTWGRHKARTRPSPGNHDYHTSGAAGYFAYFGANAGDAGKGYYSYDLGAWHIVSLNSNVSATSSSAQALWLAADLAANTKSCVLAYWHHARFSSGQHGNNTKMAALWELLYQHDADVVVQGHDHDYERFAPMTSTGVRDDARGLRSFVVGTGGTGLRSFATVQPNSEVREATQFGVIKFELSDGAYRWSFITTAGAVRDSGSGTCH